MRRRSRALSRVFLLLALSLPAISQTVTGTIPASFASDPQAVALIQQAQLALTGGTQVADTTVNTGAIWIVGKTSVTGTATLKTRGLTESRLDLSANGATHSEIRNDQSGQWVDVSGKAHDFAVHNCWGPTAWFSPQSIITGYSATDVVLSYIAQETRAGLQVDHVRAYRTVLNQKPKIAALIKKLSTVDLYLDPTTHLPLALTYNSHPDDDYTHDVPVEIRFADYRPFSGLNLPHRIQRLINGDLDLDMSLLSASVNTGLDDSAFQPAH